MKTKTPKPKKPFLAGYKKYDTKDGFGNPQEWVSSFYERMGFEKAVEVLGEDDPLVIFGLKSTATWEDIKAAYKKLFLYWHPDRNKADNAEEMTKKINAAYEVLEQRFGK